MNDPTNNLRGLVEELNALTYAQRKGLFESIDKVSHRYLAVLDIKGKVETDPDFQRSFNGGKWGQSPLIF